MQNEIFFNELCLTDKPNDYSVLKNLKECYQKLKSEEFSVCRLDSETKMGLFDYLKNISGVSRSAITSFFYSFFHAPFEKESMADEIEDKFLQHELCLETQNVIGLQWAYTYGTLSFSLLTNDRWNCDSITVVDKSDSDKSLDIHHAATVANIESQKRWIDSLKEIELVKTALLPEQKSFNVSGTHHGNDKRRLFWDRIKNDEYVVSCITSTENHSYENNLVRQVFNDGKIEIVLCWEDAGYSFLIQTTGRDYRETKKIADMLAKKYSK